MKILYDHQIFSYQDFGGISRYFYESIERIANLPETTVQCSLLLSNNEYISESKIITSTPFLKKLNFRGQRRIMYYLNEVVSKRAIATNRFDIFHPTYYSPYYSSLNVRKPVVLTCYDLIHEKFAQSETTLLDMKRKSIAMASKIIAISQHTKNDLVEYYNIPENKVEVIYLASSLKKGNARKASDVNYFLFVGNRGRYKNFSLFVEAIAPMLISQDLHLYCAGGGVFTKEEHSFLRNLKLEKHVKHCSASDENLTMLYANAIAFFFPSMYEGFGIPLLEAMSCGCPVVASNTSSLPEIAGNAALYFDPTDKDSILHSAEKIFGDSTLRTSLIQRGIEREKMFSWDHTARQSYNLYSSLS